MGRIFFIALCIINIHCFAQNLDSIRVGKLDNINAEAWDIYVQQCLNKNKESCKILMKDGLKTQEDCDSKKECVAIGEIFWNLDLIEESMPFFDKSCKAKNTHGCYFIGLNKIRRQEYIKAIEYLKKTCSKKHSASCFKLGWLYENGKGTRQDYEKVMELYKKSCKLDYAKACFSLGNLHQEGKVLSHDLSLAKEFYGIACDLGMQKGCDLYKELNQAGIPSLYSKRSVF